MQLYRNNQVFVYYRLSVYDGSNTCIVFFKGYQPPLELLTQIISQGGVYDRQRQEFQPMEEALIVAAATLPTIPG